MSSEFRSYFKKIIRRNEFFVFLLFISIIVIFTSINSSFITPNNLFSLLRFHSYEGILAVGFFIVLLSGGIDVSFTAIAVSGMYLGIRSMIEFNIDNIFFGLLIAAIVGTILGLINASLIALFELPTLIVTLGTLGIFQGLLMTFAEITGVTAINSPPSSVINFGKINIFTVIGAGDKVIGFSLFALLFIVVALITWAFLKYSILGRGIYALGGNIEAARRSGFNIKKIQFFIYSYVGFLAGIAGFIHGAGLRYVKAQDIVGKELLIIAAVVLGGAKITGGTGSVFGTVIGFFIITIIHNSLVLIKIPSYFQEAILGMIVILSITFTSYREKIKSSRAIIIESE